MVRQLALWVSVVMIISVAGAVLVGCKGKQPAETEVAGEPGGEPGEPGAGGAEEAASPAAPEEGEEAAPGPGAAPAPAGAPGVAAAPQMSEEQVTTELMKLAEARLKDLPEIPKGKTFKDVMPDLMATLGPWAQPLTPEQRAQMPKEMQEKYDALLAAKSKKDVIAALQPMVGWVVAEAFKAGAQEMLVQIAQAAATGVMPELPKPEELAPGLDLSDERIFGEFDPELRPEYMTTIAPEAPVYWHKQVQAATAPLPPPFEYGTHVWPKDRDFSGFRFAISDQRLVSAAAGAAGAPGEGAGPTEGEGAVSEGGGEE